MVGAPVRRRQVAYLCHGGLSIRRACALMSVARSTLRYESRLVKRDAPVVAVMRELAAQYPRYGYRRIQVFLSRRGHVMSADRTHRLWRLNGLQVPRKRPRRRVAAHRPRPLAPTGANQVWAYDFLFDACANGQQLKCLTVIDEYTRSVWRSMWRAASVPVESSRCSRSSSAFMEHRGICDQITARSLSPGRFCAA